MVQAFNGRSTACNINGDQKPGRKLFGGLEFPCYTVRAEHRDFLINSGLFVVYRLLEGLYHTVIGRVHIASGKNVYHGVVHPQQQRNNTPDLSAAHRGELVGCR